MDPDTLHMLALAVADYRREVLIRDQEAVKREDLYAAELAKRDKEIARLRKALRAKLGDAAPVEPPAEPPPST